MEGLVTSGWWCEFGFPLTLLRYAWVGQGGAPFHGWTKKSRLLAQSLLMRNLWLLEYLLV